MGKSVFRNALLGIICLTILFAGAHGAVADDNKNVTIEATIAQEIALGDLVKQIILQKVTPSFYRIEFAGDTPTAMRIPLKVLEKATTEKDRARYLEGWREQKDFEVLLGTFETKDIQSEDGNVAIKRLRTDVKLRPATITRFTKLTTMAAMVDIIEKVTSPQEQEEQNGDDKSLHVVLYNISVCARWATDNAYLETTIGMDGAPLVEQIRYVDLVMYVKDLFLVSSY